MKKKIVTIVMSISVALGLSMAALASTTTVTTAMTDAFQTVVTDIITTITGILPIALSVLGLTLVVAFGIKWFKRIIGKS